MVKVSNTLVKCKGKIFSGKAKQYFGLPLGLLSCLLQQGRRYKNASLEAFPVNEGNTKVASQCKMCKRTQTSLVLIAEKTHVIFSLWLLVVLVIFEMILIYKCVTFGFG